MNNDQVIRLISAIGQFIGVLIWPAVLVFFFVWFRRGLTEFISNLGAISFKAAGVEATATRRAAEAAAAVGAAAATQTSGAGADGATVDPREVVDALPGSRAQRRLQGSRVLWVDDSPRNNIYERQALEALGIQIDLSTSTDDALAGIRRYPYDLIISDMGRPPDARAGYTLLSKLRDAGIQTPFYIYASSRAPEHVREAVQRGAIGCTNSPQELISDVTAALAARARGRS